MAARDYERFQDLKFADFARRANDDSLSMYEKIGFPDEYRAGKEQAIFADIVGKLPALGLTGKTVLDIGPGCSELPRMLDRMCEANAHTLILVDSAEMLAHNPERAGIERYAARFPECPELLHRYVGAVDAILAYSVLHHVFAEASMFAFLDAASSLLAPGGRLLVGDVPNVSKRKRFFSSAAGISHHQSFTGTDEVPLVQFNRPEPGLIDDGVLIGVVIRARQAGYDAYIVPQPDGLPMSNRREDLIIARV
jgi:hypothetical protein